MSAQKEQPAHPPGIRAFGPIPIGPGMCAPDARSSPRASRCDLGPFRGQQIAVSRHAAAELLGLSVLQVDRLVGAGALKEASGVARKGRPYLLLDPAWSSVDVHDAWVSGQPMPARHADFVPFENVRRWCRLPDEHPYPTPVLEVLFQKLVEIGNFSRAEVAVFLSLNERRWNVVKPWLNDRLGKFCLTRTRSARVSLEMFRLSLPRIMQTAPQTCFEPIKKLTAKEMATADTCGLGDDWGEFADHVDAIPESAIASEGKINFTREAPSANARRRVWEMDELYLTSSLYALVAAPALRRSSVVNLNLGIIAKVEAIMRIHAPEEEWTAERYLTAFRAYAIDQTILPNETAQVRWNTVRMFRIIIGRLHSYLRRQPRSFAAQMRALIAPRIILPFDLRREMHDKFGDLRIAGREERKKSSHKAMDELDMIQAAATNRRDEMRTLGEAVRGEIAGFSENEKFREVGVKLPVLDERGTLAGGEQKVWIRVWRCDDALISMDRAPFEEGDLRHRSRRREGAPPIVTPKFITEVLDTLPVGMSTTRAPWMIELDRLGVFGKFGSASTDMKEARHRAIVDRRLPGYVSPAAGTLNFDLWRGHIRRFGLEVGRHFAPIEQQEYGIRLAFHAFDCVNQSYNRAHEVRQQLRNSWRKLDFGPELLARQGEEWFRQDVIGKVQRRRDLAEVAPVPLGIRETSYMEMIAITELHKRHAGLKKFPVMDAPEDFKWKCGPGQYVFSSFGRTLTRQQLQIPLWYLLDGWDDYTLHDFRHAEAEDAALDGYSVRLIAFLLGQQSIDSALYYSKLDDWAREVVDRENLRRREEEQDRRATEMEKA